MTLTFLWSPKSDFMIWIFWLKRWKLRCEWVRLSSDCMCVCVGESIWIILFLCKTLFHEFFIFCLGFGLFIGHHKTSKGVNLSFRKLWSVFCLLFGHFINRIGKKNTQVKRNLRLLTASLDQRRHRGQKPPSSSPILSSSPSSTMTDRWISGGFGLGGERGAGVCEETPPLTIHRPGPGGSCEKWRC